MAKSGGTPRRPVPFSDAPRGFSASSLNRAAGRAPDDTKLAMDRLRALQAAAQAAGSLEKRSERIALLTKVTAEAEALRAKYMASPQAQRSLERQAFFLERFNRLQKESVKASRGPGAEKEDQKKHQQEQQLQAAIGTATALFRSGLSHIQSMVASSDFTTFATLTDSFKLLAATIGTEFAPYIDAVSLKIQQLTRWFSSLDENTKSWIAKISIGTLAALGFAGALWKISGALKLVGINLTALMANPAFLALLAAAGAIVLLTKDFSNGNQNSGGSYSPESKRWQGVEMGMPDRSNYDPVADQMTRGRMRRGTPFQNNMTYASLQIARLFGGGDFFTPGADLKEDELVGRLPKKVQEELKKAKSSDEYNLILAKASKESQSELEKSGPTSRPYLEYLRDAATGMRDRGSRDIAFNQTDKRGKTGIAAFAAEALLQMQKTSSDELLRSTKLPVQSRFSGFSEYADSLQTNALNTTELEGRILETQLKNTEKVAGLITRVESLLSFFPPPFNNP